MKTLGLSLVALPVGLMLFVVFAVAALVGAVAGSPSPPPPVGGAGPLAIPTAMVRLYAAASMTCPGLSWAVPAAIGTVESANGTSGAPGVHSGANFAGAEGPMQFEPATFAAYDLPVPPGGASPPSPYDATDAVFAAVRMLCQNGAASPGSLARAIWDYNHSSRYVDQVLSLAAGYGYAAAVGARSAAAVDYALAQLGTPYVWGGETAGAGFDCSGLAQAAWAWAGVRLPRVAQDQYDAGPDVDLGEGIQAGDLVFFGAGARDISHVGIVVSAGGLMVDAPNTGSVVRVESFPVSVGSMWGDDEYIGATDPGRAGAALSVGGGVS
jgi:cell wall-associated NlpC family hydrolase